MAVKVFCANFHAYPDSMKHMLVLVAVVFSLQSEAQKALSSSSIFQLKQVSSPEVSPDKKWIAYVVTSTDSAEDKNDDNIWMTAVDGSGSMQLTYSDDDEDK